MSSKRRWYYEHWEREKTKHREYQKGYMAKHREKYRISSSEYYRRHKEALKNMPKPVVNLEPGIPKKLNDDGIMLLFSAVIDQCRADIRLYERYLARAEKKKNYKGVSYTDYMTAKYFLQEMVPVLEIVYKKEF